MARDSQGNLWLGAALGFFLGLIGVAGAYIFGGTDTRKGSLYGFGVAIALFILIFIIGAIAS